MTRDFNKPRRNDSRPPFRNTFSNRYSDEKPAHPARPRLNRARVDHAWEFGAQPTHADYHPRNKNGVSQRVDRNDRRSGSNTTQNKPRPHSHQHVHGERPRFTSNRYQDSHARPDRRYRHTSPDSQSADQAQGNTTHSSQKPHRYYRSQQDGDRHPNVRHTGNRRFTRPSQYRGNSSYDSSAPKKYTSNNRFSAHRPKPTAEKFEGDYEQFTNYEDQEISTDKTPKAKKNKTAQQSPTEGKKPRKQRPEGIPGQKKLPKTPRSNVAKPSQRGFKWPTP